MNIEKILVSVSGAPVDDEVIAVGAALARRFSASIYAIYVIEVERALPIDAEIESEIEKGEHLLDRVEQECESEQIPVETALLQAREIGPAIVDEAIERNVDGIVIGITEKRRPGESELRNTTTYLLKNAPCRVWLVRGLLGDQQSPR